MRFLREFFHHLAAELKEVSSFLARVAGSLVLGAVLTVSVWGAYRWLGAPGVLGSFALIYLVMRGLERWGSDGRRSVVEPLLCSPSTSRVVAISRRKQEQANPKGHDDYVPSTNS